MKPESQEYEGHRIEIRDREGKFELLIDNIPIKYGQMHHGMYFLHDYAFDHTNDLMELARRYVVYRDKPIASAAVSGPKKREGSNMSSPKNYRDTHDGRKRPFRPGTLSTQVGGAG